MDKKNQRVWIWLKDCELYKAVYYSADRKMVVFNEQDDIILIYTDVTAEKLKELEKFFARVGAKHLDNRSEPFTYL
jgi:hypothetical protein